MSLRLRAAVLALFLLTVAGYALNRAFPPDLRPAANSALLLLAANGQPIAARGSSDHFWRLPTTANEVDPAFIGTLISTEDRRFYSTPGADPIALLRAAFEDVKAGRIVSGGSGITMQVVRLLYPHKRTFAGKAFEIIRAVQLAATEKKSKILALYLTLAPYGGNIEGVQAASWLYFGHGAGHLSQPEIALLVALPRRPEALRPDRHPDAAIQAVARIYAQNHLGPPPATLAGAVTRHQFPGTAPYLAEHLWAQGTRGIATTTIDADLQAQIGAIAIQSAATFGNGTDDAILVIHNRDLHVTAYAGGAGGARPGGEIDMIQAIRSPGSTLKPFIYGMAFDANLATPATLIDDTPLANASYDPADFDRAWHGIVPVTVALQQSYNLPAVKMLAAIGPRALAATLRAAGMNLVLPPGDTHPSLALALGGVGVRLQDLCALYAGFAGPPRSLQYLAGQPPASRAAVMSAAAAAQILGILEGLPPPDGTSGFGARAVAYKTGTSYGFRDAWSIGVSADWTVGIWVGRPDGTPRPGAYGLNTAAPLMAKIFSLLPPDRGTLPPPVIALATRQTTAPSLAHLQATSGPRITFPPPGATLELDPGNPVNLAATGGAPPYRWLIDNTEIPPPPIGESAIWSPPSPGFFTITAIDQTGQPDSETLQVK